MRFRTRIHASGATTTGIPVPEEVLAGLGAGRKPAVRVTVGGHTYRSTIATVEGGPMISLSAENRTAAGVAAGDEVDVEVDVDSAPREVDVPADFAAALGADPEAARTFEALSYSNKRWHVLSIEGARSADTRQRRVAKSVALLHAGRAR
ncbi:hypothetical protein BH24CHL9_BH24CHL9_12040 [soil metagenome]